MGLGGGRLATRPKLVDLGVKKHDLGPNLGFPKVSWIHQKTQPIGP